MLHLPPTLKLIIAKILLLKSITLTFIAPYISLGIASILFNVIGIIIAAAILYISATALISTVKYATSFISSRLNQEKPEIKAGLAPGKTHSQTPETATYNNTSTSQLTTIEKVIENIKSNKITKFIIADKEIKNNKQVVLAAVKIDGSAIRFASEKLRSDYDVALAAVTKTPSAIEHIPSTIQGYENIAITAVKNNSSAMQHISSDSEHYKDIAVAAVTANSSAIKKINKDHKDYEEILGATNSGNNLTPRKLFK